MDIEFLSTTEDREIRSVRVVQAPVARVFTAWTDPAYLSQWWGPAGFTNTFLEFDLRVGGIWKFIMHGPDKGNYANACEFIRIEPPSLLAWKRHSKPLFHVVATFKSQGVEQTRIVFRMVFDSAAECAKVKKFAVEKNEENFDRLEKVLATMP